MFTTITLMTMLKNDLFLKALNGETVNRPPVWMMRQAGRYLPDFMKLKAKYEFFTRCQTPELATEITIIFEHSGAYYSGEYLIIVDFH